MWILVWLAVKVGRVRSRVVNLRVLPVSLLQPDWLAAPVQSSSGSSCALHCSVCYTASQYTGALQISRLLLICSQVNTDWNTLVTWLEYWALIGYYLVTWPQYWALIGQYQVKSLSRTCQNARFKLMPKIKKVLFIQNTFSTFNSLSSVQFSVLSF